MKFMLKRIVLIFFLLCQWGMPATAQTSVAHSLKIALIHYAVKHKDPAENLKALLELNRSAAQQGARLILNTELAVSGYSFSSRRDIAPYTETDQGKTMAAMAALAREQKVYIGITFPEQDPLTQSYYNSAFVLDPGGKIICRYRKIYGERRWARPGSPYQEGIFNTPWGRMGIAICADSYFGLIPRTLALKGVDLLWVPANWPPTGGLNPLEVWQTRALENGIYLAACNRTGKDLTMDCTRTVSAVVAPTGKPLFSESSATSKIFVADIPLDDQGRLSHVHRQQCMASRQVNNYRNIYLKPWVENLTGYYRLPETGVLDVHCFVPPPGKKSLPSLTAAISEKKNDHPTLWVLPQGMEDKISSQSLLLLAQNSKVAFAVSLSMAKGDPAVPVLITPEGQQFFMESDIEPDTGQSPFFPYKILHHGPAAIAMVPVEALQHPELAVILAKLGCDLVVCSEKTLSWKNLLLSRMRTVNGVAVATCARNAAEITCMQGLHGGRDHQYQDHPGICSYQLDTAGTRKKYFDYCIDYDLLLKPSASTQKKVDCTD
ncbi:carbon-nitrogen hydrolase family protein [Desulfocicer niacini]